MKEFQASEGWRRYLCPTKAVLEAYTATAQGIHSSLARYDKGELLTMHEAALIADRIREGRQLIHQVLSRRGSHKHMRRMMRVHILQRDRLFAIAERCKLAVSILKERCRTHTGSATLK
ncbi:MAG: hypothetical protein PHE68_04660 [Candidatus Peribacteraceae bacterium]|nr:hypothetical protein [Candidatus Peribacteraceae bacterium]MDD5074351.1 hypothetical protein [Candidatus Peribacteraceae bacterium]